MIEWINSMVGNFTSVKITAFVNLLSILGFFVTIYVGFGIRKIRSQYVAKIRVPALKAQLQNHVSTLSSYLNDYTNNKNLIVTEIAQLDPVLHALKKRLKWSERNKIKQVLDMLERRRKYMENNEAGVREFFNYLHGLISELEQWENDKSVES